MKAYFLTLILLAISGTAQAKNFSEVKVAEVDSISITISLDDEGWHQHASSEDGILHSKKVVAMRLSTSDGSALSEDAKGKLILLAGNECSKLEDEIYAEQSAALANKSSKVKIYKRSSRIPETTLNTINKDMVFARCHVDFQSK